MGRVCEYRSGYAIYDKTGKRLTHRIPTKAEARKVNLYFQQMARLKRRKR